VLRLTTDRAARTAPKASPPSVLVLREAAHPDQSMLVYYDGTDTAESALRLAVALTRMSPPRPLVVLLPADNADEIQRLHDAVTERYSHTVPNCTSVRSRRWKRLVSRPWLPRRSTASSSFPPERPLLETATCKISSTTSTGQCWLFGDARSRIFVDPLSQQPPMDSWKPLFT